MTHWLDTATFAEDEFDDLRGADAGSLATRDARTKALRRELAPSHVLASLEWEVVASAISRDEVVLRLADGRAAVVHLSYPKSAPDRPPWPSTWFAADADALAGLLRDRC